MKPPEQVGEKTRSHGHTLVAEAGNFSPLIWRCRDCDLTAVSKTAKDWRVEDCEGGDD